MLSAGGAVATAKAAPESPAAKSPALRVGLLTDIHYADRKPAGTRHYRESIGKVREAVEKFNREKLDLVVELGDFVDAATTVEDEVGFLRKIESEYARFSGHRHYVLGNHCVTTLTKREFFDNSAATRGHHSFDRGGFHFVILDACYRQDGVPYGRNNFTWTDTEIPAAERAWLVQDLKMTKKKSIVFVHQRLDVSNHYGVRSAPLVRKILEESGRVLAVFQGHSHENDYREIRSVHYCTLAAVVEGSGKTNSAYAVLDLMTDGSLRLDGFRKQTDRRWPAVRST